MALEPMVLQIAMGAAVGGADYPKAAVRVLRKVLFDARLRLRDDALRSSRR
jgi:hypothetical protein